MCQDRKLSTSVYRNANKASVQLAERANVWRERGSVCVTQIAQCVRREEAECGVRKRGDDVRDRVHQWRRLCRGRTWHVRRLGGKPRRVATCIQAARLARER